MIETLPGRRGGQQVDYNLCQGATAAGTRYLTHRTGPDTRVVESWISVLWSLTPRTSVDLIDQPMVCAWRAHSVWRRSLRRTSTLRSVCGSIRNKNTWSRESWSLCRGIRPSRHGLAPSHPWRRHPRRLPHGLLRHIDRLGDGTAPTFVRVCGVSTSQQLSRVEVTVASPSSPWQLKSRRRGGNRLTTTWHPGADGPEGFYVGLGFRPTGETIGGQTVGELPLW